MWVADVPGSNDKYVALFNARDVPPFTTDQAAFKSELVTRDTPGQAVAVDVDIKGAEKLYLAVDTGGDNFDCDHVAWIEPTLIGPDGEKKLTDIEWVSATTGWGKAAINKNVNGGPIIVDNQPVAFGIGAHSPSLIEYKLPPGYTGFKAKAGLEKSGVDQRGGATVRFYVLTSDPRAKSAVEGIPVPVKFADLGFTGQCGVRDLWQRKDMGTLSGQFAPIIKPHGAGLYRISGTK